MGIYKSMENISKSIRILELYNKFQNGEEVDKVYEANNYGVSEKTIERDFNEINAFFEREASEKGVADHIKNDHSRRKHYLRKVREGKLSKSEILAISKILLDSRAFTKERMDQIIEKLVSCCAIKEEQKIIHKLIDNEKFYYTELKNKKEILEMLWEIGQAIQDQKYIEIEYEKLGQEAKKRKLKPAAIMFSEFYFYMAAFMEDEEKKNFDVPNDVYPTIYRINRIKELTTLEEKYKIESYSDRFKEGEFRKRIQFMFGGKLRRIKLKCNTFSLEAVLDRFPTAKILSEDNGVYTITAEVFGDGVDMWLRGQGKNVEVIGN